MTYKVDVKIDEAYVAEVNPRMLRVAARAALAHEAVSAPAALTVALTGDKYLRTLSRKFLGLDATTDVLSFPSEARNGEFRKVKLRRATRSSPGLWLQSYLGDIAISFPRARAQAEAAGHPVAEELQLLVVHGVLHLLGYDHAKEADTTRMWVAQEDILRAIRANA